MNTLTRIFPVLILCTLGPPAGATEYRPLTTECETALARSALPAHLRERANVYVMGKQGYKRKGSAAADFSCLVARNHPDSLIPQCFDGPGQRAILPKFIDEAKLLAQGWSFDEIRAEISSRLDKGYYTAADTHGLVYMMSPYNYIYGTNAGRLLHIHPHVMFHAPHLDADAVGNSFAQAMENTGLPFVIDEGVHGYMVSMVAKPAAANEVEESCVGQLPEPPAG